MNLPNELPRVTWLPEMSGGSGERDSEVVEREFSFGSNTHPYLADHGFHDMAVLPGSFYIELVRFTHQQVFGHPANDLHRISFERPVLLAEDVTLTVRARRNERQGSIAYEVFEASVEQLHTETAPAPCAHLEVSLSADGGKSDSTSVVLQDQSATRSAAAFYSALRRNGNQYGPGFQVLDHIQQTNAEVVGQIVGTARSATGSDDLLSPPLLDAMPQLLASFTLEQGKTFILQSIQNLRVVRSTGTEPCSVRVSRTDAASMDAANLVGEARVVDAHGIELWSASGVTLAFIDPPAASASALKEKLRICVASTFTAEPLEDSLTFWGDHFGRPVEAEFAPYNQVFQQLLDPASAFYRNRSGINFIVLALEDWLHENKHILRSPETDRADACFGARARTILPNGLEIAHLNRYETDYVYQEIFGDLSYLRHDIQLADGNTVIDIGANIGLFSLFVMSQCHKPAIYAFEPSPRVHDLLRANCAAYGDPSRVKAFNAGVAEKKGSAQFTFYQHSSVFSSFHPDEHEDRAAIEAVVRNVVENEMQDAGDVSDADVHALTTQRLQAETIDCPLTSVSDIIRENGLQKIHLLKIDAEKSEIGILRGIAEEHWPLIEQIVMEIHDRSRAAVDEIEQQLVARGFRCAVVEEKLLQESGLFNIYATRRPIAEPQNRAASGLQKKVDEFCAALEGFVSKQPAPLVLAVTPRAEIGVDPSRDEALAAAEQQILSRASRHSQIRTVSSQAILEQYPVTQLHDAHSHQLGHIPFTPEGFAAIGTALSRAAFGIGVRPVKVIALDCDNTLWAGTCGEDGAAGISIPQPFRYLQEFMVRQAEAGVLLALCSKNEEADVQAVFDLRSEMPLRREHIAATQINWDSKPQNLRALAATLNLGLESFVFIDDNPVECAAVLAACPEVTVLQLPADTATIPTFLDALWILDHANTTREDRERSEWYRANAEREEMKAVAPTLADFLEGLQLKVDITEISADQLARVAQLTLRTNQFNLTTVRRSEGELQQFLTSGGRVLVTSVADRFGDYGLVGAVLYQEIADRIIVDTMLLSCRALGKGIEHHMLSDLAKRAQITGKTMVQLSYRPTERNEPARAFVEKLTDGGYLPKGSAATFEVAASTLATLRYAPDEQAASATSVASPTESSVKASRGLNLSTPLQRLGSELNCVAAVVAAIDSKKRQANTSASSELSGLEVFTGADALERSLESIWKKALGRASIGFNENFFDAGGTSLQAVGVVAMIRRHLSKNASIVALFECPTISLLAARLRSEDAGHDEAGEAAAASAESRGRQRKIKLVKRKTASA